MSTSPVPAHRIIIAPGAENLAIDVDRVATPLPVAVDVLEEAQPQAPQEGSGSSWRAALSGFLLSMRDRWRSPASLSDRDIVAEEPDSPASDAARAELGEEAVDLGALVREELQRRRMPIPEEEVFAAQLESARQYLHEQFAISGDQMPNTSEELRDLARHMFDFMQVGNDVPRRDMDFPLTPSIASTPSPHSFAPQQPEQSWGDYCADLWQRFNTCFCRWIQSVGEYFRFCFTGRF
jgi:hypothetical protein